jgi:DNA-3-methyladenine glycosylase
MLDAAEPQVVALGAGPMKAPPPAAPHGRAFYAREAEVVARELVGCVLVHAVEGRRLEARIVETEAYVGDHDLACHASKGLTSRTAIMFGPAGHAYVYLIYGLHTMLNVVTGPVGSGQAVLVRAAEPVDPPSVDLSGPGRLARRLHIDLGLNGADLCRGPLSIGPGTPPAQIGVSARIGVDYAGAWADAPLRFFDLDSRQVSRRRRRSA